MRLLRLAALALCGLGVADVVAQSLGSCGAATVTIANTTITATYKTIQTVTVTAPEVSPLMLLPEYGGTTPAYASAASVDLEGLSANAQIAPTNPTPTFAPGQTDTTGITGTSTVFFTYTQTVQVVYNTQTSTASFRGNKAVYYYANINNTTVWLSGITPKSSGGVAVSGETTVMVSPLPTLEASAGKDSSVDENEPLHTTITVTRTLSNVHTSTIPRLSLNATANSTSFMTTTVTALTTSTDFFVFTSGDSSLSNYQVTLPTSNVIAFSVTTAPINSSLAEITTHHGPTPHTTAAPANVSASETQSFRTPPPSNFSFNASGSSVQALPTNTSDSNRTRSTVTETSTRNGWGVFYSVGSSKGPMTTSADIRGLIGSLTAASSTAKSTTMAADASVYHNQYRARKVRRQVGAPVIATIDGKVVTWANNWDGEKAATSATDLSVPASSSPTTSKMHPAHNGYASLVQGHDTTSKQSNDVSSEEVPSTTVSSEVLPTLTSKAREVSAHSHPASKESSLVTSSMKLSSTLPSQSVPSSVVTSVVQVVEQSMSATAFKTSVSSSVKSQVAPFANSTCTKCMPSSVSSSPLPTATTCGEVGPFTLDFDDLPAYSPGNNNTANYPPIFNPYRHLFFASGFAYVPPPTDPYLPVSPPHLAIFMPPTGLNATTTGSPDAGDLTQGEFGAGPRAADSAFHFNISSAYIACDNGGPDSCKATITGLTWDDGNQKEIPSITQYAEIPPCPALANCNLTRVDLAGFNGLSGFSVFAQVANRSVIWFIDEVEVDWANNTCAAGLERQMSR